MLFLLPGIGGSRCLCWGFSGDLLGIHESMCCLVTASFAHAPFLVVANQISPFNTTRSGSSLTVKDSVLSSTMEAIRTGSSKGIFSLGRYLGDGDVLFQFVTTP